MKYLILLFLIGCATPHASCQHLNGGDYYQCKSYHEQRNAAWINATNNMYQQQQQLYNNNNNYYNKSFKCTTVGNTTYCN